MTYPDAMQDFLKSRHIPVSNSMRMFGRLLDPEMMQGVNRMRVDGDTELVLVVHET